MLHVEPFQQQLQMQWMSLVAGKEVPLQLLQLSLDAVAARRCTNQDAAAAEEATTELRSYQQRALDQIKSGGNYILVAPTGADLMYIPQKHAM